jgi:hypothetical protein
MILYHLDVVMLKRLKRQSESFEKIAKNLKHKFFYKYSEFFFLRLAIGFYMLIFQTPVNFCSDENVQTIFGTKLEDLLNYRIDYNSISQTVEKVVKKIFLACRKCPKLEIVRCWLSRQWRYSGGRSTYYYFGALKTIFFTTFSTVWDIKL